MFRIFATLALALSVVALASFGSTQKEIAHADTVAVYVVADSAPMFVNGQPVAEIAPQPVADVQLKKDQQKKKSAVHKQRTKHHAAHQWHKTKPHHHKSFAPHHHKSIPSHRHSSGPNNFSPFGSFAGLTGPPVSH